MFSSLWAKIKEFFSSMFGVNQKIEEALKVTPAVSDKMSEAIDEWTAMYMDEAEWLHEPTPEDKTRVVSLGLPAFIASEKARMAVLELKSEITAPTKTERKPNPEYFPPVSDEFGNIKASGVSPTIVAEIVEGDTRRADYLNEQYHKKLLSKLRTQLEYGTAKGSLIIKPYVVRSKVTGIAGIEEDKQTTSGEEQYQYKMEFDFIQADCFYPFSFDSSQNLTDVAFVQTITRNQYVYTRLERHKLNVNNVIIENYAFRSTMSANQDAYNNGLGGLTLGTEIPLTEVPEWKDIPPKATINNVDRLLFGYFKMPEANTIDPHSPLGMSCFGRARDLIKDADEQYSRLLWEFEGGQLAIDIDRDALQFLSNDKGGGHSVMGQLQERLYRTIDLGESDTYRPFSPSLRDVSLINGLNQILMRIEDVCAMSRGTISDVTSEARTATEIKILKQRSFSANKEIQEALQVALEDVIYAMNVYVTLYNIVGDIKYSGDKVDTSEMGSYDVSFEWDDSILIDEDTELATRLSLHSQGIESKLSIRMWYFGETERQAQEALNKVTQENKEAIEQNMVMSSQLGDQVRSGKEKTQDNEDKDEQKQAQSVQPPKPTQNPQQTTQNGSSNKGTELTNAT